jgi:hypothetical protein
MYKMSGFSVSMSNKSFINDIFYIQMLIGISLKGKSKAIFCIIAAFEYHRRLNCYHSRILREAVKRRLFRAVIERSVNAQTIIPIHLNVLH